MNFYDNYYNVAQKIRSKSARQEFYAAVIEYYYTGVEPTFKYESAEVGFTSVLISLDKSRQNKANRSKTKHEGNANENGTNEEEIKNSSDEDIFLSSISSNLLSSEEVPMEETSFPIECLKAFNDVFGTTYSTLPSNAAHTLVRMEGRYSIEEVRQMLIHRKGLWENTKWSAGLTPKKLFGSDDFESYMIQSKREEASHDNYDVGECIEI